jgi:hypothetical protein
MSNRPTSRQFQGHFNALRAIQSHSVIGAIDIAFGNYGSGKVFPGAIGLSDTSWVSATGIFYIYIDKFDNLILDDTNYFPSLCTKIARVEIAGGIVIDVIDERAEVNGLTDAYQVAFDDSSMQIAYPADNIQEAIHLLDAYLAASQDSSRTLRYIDLDVGGGIKNGLVRYSHLDDAPAIEFPKRPTGVGRIRYSISVPKNWVSDTDIVFKIFWSPETADAGNVKWRLSYRRATSGTNIDTPMTTVSIIQPTPNILNRLVDTDESLKIQASNIQLEDILIINIEREYSIDDTYNATVRMHLARIEYISKG